MQTNLAFAALEVTQKRRQQGTFVPCCPVLLSYVNDHTDVLFEQINDDDDDDDETSLVVYVFHSRSQYLTYNLLIHVLFVDLTRCHVSLSSIVSYGVFECFYFLISVAVIIVVHIFYCLHECHSF